MITAAELLELYGKCCVSEHVLEESLKLPTDGEEKEGYRVYY